MEYKTEKNFFVFKIITFEYGTANSSGDLINRIKHSENVLYF